MPIGEPVTAKTEIFMDMGNIIMSAGMVMDTIRVPMDPGGIDYVEIYQKISVFCHNCRRIHDWGGADGFDSAGHHEQDCG